MPHDGARGPSAPGSAPWMRSLREAARLLESALATDRSPSRPTAKRAAFIMMNMYSSPRFSSPINSPTAPPFCPNASTQVGLAWMPSLCSTDRQRTSLRAPSEPSGSIRNFGHQEQRDALDALGRVRRARQHHVDDVVGEIVLAVGDENLLALQLVPPAAERTARVRTAARSEPACGSVRFMVPVHSPDTIFGRYVRFCRSEPLRWIASIAPRVSMGQSAKAMFAPFHISSISEDSTRGRSWPPYSRGQASAPHPPPTNFAYASRQPDAVSTCVSCQRTPSTSPLRLIGDRTPAANLAASSRMASPSSRVASSNPGNREMSAWSVSSRSTNCMSASGA